MPRYGLLLLAIGLMVFALAECTQSDDDERAGLPKGVWVILIVVFPLLGPIAWFVVSRTHRQAAASSGGWGPVTPPTPLAPDDDPEFLWRLESERRRSARGTPDRQPGDPIEPSPGRGGSPGPAPHQPDEPGTDQSGPGDLGTGDGST